MGESKGACDKALAVGEGRVCSAPDFTADNSTVSGHSPLVDQSPFVSKSSDSPSGKASCGGANDTWGEWSVLRDSYASAEAQCLLARLSELITELYGMPDVTDIAEWEMRPPHGNFYVFLDPKDGTPVACGGYRPFQIDKPSHYVLPDEMTEEQGEGRALEILSEQKEQVRDGALEMKRIFVNPLYRGRGVGQQMVDFLECEVVQTSCRQHKPTGGRTDLQMFLNTGELQEDAIRLYSRRGYTRSVPFGMYRLFSGNLSFVKELRYV